MFELQKYGGVIFHDTEELCKLWRKTDQWFEKRHEKFGKFSPEHLKVSKLRLWWDHFVQSRKGMTLNFTEEFYVMTMKNNVKSEEELTCYFKKYIRNLMNFDFNEFWLKNLKKLLFNWLLSPKYIMFELRRVQRGYVWWHWRLMQNLTCAFKKDMRNLANTHRLK